MTSLELLAPARNADIGIAAIDCGADAVYIAGPQFGARHAAGNDVGEIRRLCEYAHRFGARIFVTVNTILYEGEEEAAYRLMQQVQQAGADALIVQDLALLKLARGYGGGEPVTLPLHASTQCAIRTPEKAAFYERLGFSRLVLERQLSLEQIRAIRCAVGCELECFVHGALCVCYSGQCYLSEYLSGRSANRGDCIQACRSRYDLEDGDGRVLVRDKALLSLKDLQLRDRLPELAESGVCSFKIEGRLKNLSYVRNVVREYSLALDALVAAAPEKYCRASYGSVIQGFTPDTSKTFNRGYTKLFIDGSRGRWASMDTPKGMGEEIGTVLRVERTGRDGMWVTLRPRRADLRLRNGDGFSFPSEGGPVGFRGDVCEGMTIRGKYVPGLGAGTPLYRNLSQDFEKQLESTACIRRIPVRLRVTVSGGYAFAVEAESEDGRKISLQQDAGTEAATNPDRILSMIENQLGKSAGDFVFSVDSVSVSTPDGSVPIVGAAWLNHLRREVADLLSRQPCRTRPMGEGQASPASAPAEITYRENVSNPLSAAVYRESGAVEIEPAYELSHRSGAELMRTKYCIRYEQGMCPKYQGGDASRKLFLLNNGRRLALGFDCARCEMTVAAEPQDGGM